MESIKQFLRVPRNHELRIKVPSNIPVNETVEVILVINDKQNNFKQKINALKSAVRDNLFIEDMGNVSKDFENIDSEGW